MSTARVKTCAACGLPVDDPTGTDALIVWEGNHPEHKAILNAIGVEQRLSPMGMHHEHVIHMACVAPHEARLGDHQRIRLLNWKIGTLHADNEAMREEMRRICRAVQQIAPNTYFEFIEEPALNSQTHQPQRSQP